MSSHFCNNSSDHVTWRPSDLIMSSRYQNVLFSRTWKIKCYCPIHKEIHYSPRSWLFFISRFWLPSTKTILNLQMLNLTTAPNCRKYLDKNTSRLVFMDNRWNRHPKYGTCLGPGGMVPIQSFVDTRRQATYRRITPGKHLSWNDRAQ